MTQFLINCTTLSLEQLKHKNLAISISAMVCFVLTAAIIFLLIFYRAYRTVLQRFFQYLTFVTLLHLFFISMDIQLQSNWSHGPELCKWQGFIRQWTATMTYFFVFVITMYLVGKVYRELKSTSSITIVNLRHQRLHQFVWEGAVVACVVLLPLTFLWIPFYHDTYGIYATSCWIQKVDGHCNKSIGGIEQIAMVSVLRIIMIIVIVSFSILSILFCRFACYYHDTRKAHLRTIRQTFLLMCFFVVSSLIELTGLIMYVYSAISGTAVDSYVFWLVYDIAMPFSQLVIPSGFLVYLFSFQWKSIKRASEEWKAICKVCCTTCSKHSTCCNLSLSVSSSYSQREALHLSTDTPTAPISTRVSPPSQTYFSIKYTGGFTNIIDNSMANNTHYGSTNDS